MKLLIDTQVFIWLSDDNPRLHQKVRNLLSSTKNTLHISYFSLWEMAIKAGSGKLQYDSSIIDELPRFGIVLIMPDVESLRHYAIFDESNKDPFDNMIIAVAVKEKCTLVTSDAKILATHTAGLKTLSAY